MFTIAVVEKSTSKVLAYLPLVFDRDVDIRSPYHIEHKDYVLAIFNNTQPVLFEGTDGDIYLKRNSFIIHSGELDY